MKSPSSRASPNPWALCQDRHAKCQMHRKAEKGPFLARVFSGPQPGRDGPCLPACLPVPACLAAKALRAPPRPRVVNVLLLPVVPLPLPSRCLAQRPGVSVPLAYSHCATRLFALHCHLIAPWPAQITPSRGLRPRPRGDAAPASSAMCPPPHCLSVPALLLLCPSPGF